MSSRPSVMRARRIPDAAGLQREGVLALGGLRALLLQLAHPAVGTGVANHSTFAANPVGRLHHTLTYIYVVASDDRQLVGRVARSIGRQHAPVRSAPDARTAYDARDPALQLWVAATIHDTAVRMAELAWGPLPEALERELLARNAALGTSLGLPADDWPTDPTAFRAYVDAALADLVFDDATIGVVRELLAPSAAPRWVRAAMPLLTALTAPSMPQHLREQLDLTASPAAARRMRGAIRIAAPLYRALPARIRRLPASRYVALARSAADDR
jgi:uncharacterized protein (DUF2236 family)